VQTTNGIPNIGRITLTALGEKGQISSGSIPTVFESYSEMLKSFAPSQAASTRGGPSGSPQSKGFKSASPTHAKQHFSDFYPALNNAARVSSSTRQVDFQGANDMTSSKIYSQYLPPGKVGNEHYSRNRPASAMAQKVEAYSDLNLKANRTAKQTAEAGLSYGSNNSSGFASKATPPKVSGGQMGSQVSHVPSGPKAMRNFTDHQKTGSQFGNRTFEPINAMGLRQVDLEKGPCGRCLFVHRGSDCEKWCIGCGVTDPLRHTKTCPWVDKRRPEGNALGGISSFHPATEKETEKGRARAKEEKRSAELRAIVTELSRECQRRGFNPNWRYQPSSGGTKFKCDLYLKDVLVSGNDREYNSQQDARNALGKKGLQAIRAMKYYLPELSKQLSFIAYSSFVYETSSMSSTLALFYSNLTRSIVTHRLRQYL
jgi:hypothetical protein